MKKTSEILITFTTIIYLLCLCISIYCIHDGWNGYRFLDTCKNKLFAISFIMCIISGIELALSILGFDNINLHIALGFILAASAILLITLLSYEFEDRVKDAYSITCISCVYADHGNAKEALVEYHPEDKDAKDIKLCVSAANLGYDDVVIDNSIVKPKEKLTPDGTALAIPESYLRKSKS